MYPYRNRWRWFLFGRYSHLVRALRDHPVLRKNQVLRQRVGRLRAWNSVRFLVSIPLTAGVVAAVVAAAAAYLPGGLPLETVQGTLALGTTVTGVFTLAYLFLTRFLNQLEIDILALLTLDSN